MTSSRVLSSSQIARAALVVLLGFVTSGILGLVRTAVFAATFGTSEALDAFFAAQRIPEALFVLVAGGALGSSFIPVFSRYLANNNPEHAWKLASAVMTLTASMALVLALLVAIFAPWLVPALLVPGESLAVQSLTTTLTQIMMSTVVIFSISGLLMGILNAHQIFTLPALALSMNNIGLIVGALVFAQVLPGDGGVSAYRIDRGIADSIDIWGRLAVGANVYGLAWGAVLGAALHLLVQIPGLSRIEARVGILFNPRLEGVGEVLRLMGPRVLGLAVVQINFMVNAALSLQMVDGSLVALTTAFQLMFFALGIIAQSVGTAVFPSLSALAAAKDMEGYKERLAGALRSVLFLSFPVTVGLIVLGQPVIAVLFERGAWTAESTAATAWALAFFAIGISGFSLLEILSRAFYALANTRTPVVVGVIAMVTNIILSLVFIRFIGEPDSLSRGPFAGLALANAVTTIAEALVLWGLLRRQIGSLGSRPVAEMGFRAGVASLGMGAAVWLVTQLTAGFSPLVMAAAGGITGVVVFFGLSLLFRLEEARTIPNVLLRRVRSS